MATVEYAFPLCASILNAILPSTNGCSGRVYAEVRPRNGAGWNGNALQGSCVSRKVKLCRGGCIQSHIQERNITGWTKVSVSKSPSRYTETWYIQRDCILMSSPQPETLRQEQRAPPESQETAEVGITWENSLDQLAGDIFGWVSIIIAVPIAYGCCVISVLFCIWLHLCRNSCWGARSWNAWQQKLTTTPSQWDWGLRQRSPSSAPWAKGQGICPTTTTLWHLQCVAWLNEGCGKALQSLSYILNGWAWSSLAKPLFRWNMSLETW